MFSKYTIYIFVHLTIDIVVYFFSRFVDYIALVYHTVRMYSRKVSNVLVQYLLAILFLKKNRLCYVSPARITNVNQLIRFRFIYLLQYIISSIWFIKYLCIFSSSLYQPLAKTYPTNCIIPCYHARFTTC